LSGWCWRGALPRSGPPTNERPASAGNALAGLNRTGPIEAISRPAGSRSGCSGPLQPLVGVTKKQHVGITTGRRVDATQSDVVDYHHRRAGVFRMVRQVWSAHVSPLVSLRRALFRVRRTILISMSNVIFAAEAEMTPGVRQFFGERRLRVLIRPRPANSYRAAELQRQADEAKSSGNLKKAIRLYSGALAHTPHNAALFFLRGSALFEANRPGDAARDFVAGPKARSRQSDPDLSSADGKRPGRGAVCCASGIPRIAPVVISSMKPTLGFQRFGGLIARKGQQRDALSSPNGPSAVD
jgi:hypothetical protein